MAADKLKNIIRAAMASLLSAEQQLLGEETAVFAALLLVCAAGSYIVIRCRFALLPESTVAIFAGDAFGAVRCFDIHACHGRPGGLIHACACPGALSNRVQVLDLPARNVLHGAPASNHL